MRIILAWSGDLVAWKALPAAQCVRFGTAEYSGDLSGTEFRVGQALTGPESVADIDVYIVIYIVIYIDK